MEKCSTEETFPAQLAWYISEISYYSPKRIINENYSLKFSIKIPEFPRCEDKRGSCIWRSWIRASWYNYENNQQGALYRLIYYSKSAVHVSGDVFGYQEHLTVFTVSGIVRPSCCRLVCHSGRIMRVPGPITNTARLSPRYEGKTRGCHCSHWALDDGRENVRNFLSCKQTLG
jgi:hypothetical protein